MMSASAKIRVGLNGYGVIGKRVAAAVTRQDDMSLVGVSDVVTDWRARIVIRNGYRLFGATSEAASAMHDAGLSVTGTLHDLLEQVDDLRCTVVTVA
jgi:glyceraldehyde-3-phosphate dehydrogenase (NAD(P))